jgi:hypothetical protein
MFSCRGAQTDAACGQGVHRGQKLAHRSRQSVEAGDDQHIPFAGILQGGCKLRAIGAGAAHRFLEHALAAGSIERVDLSIGALQIGRDASIAHQHRKSPKTRPTPEQSGELFQDTVLGSFCHQFFSESEVLKGSAERERL